MKIKLGFKRKEYKGGAGSGHHGHAGRPGKRGGSLPGKGGGAGLNSKVVRTISRISEDVKNSSIEHSYIVNHDGKILAETSGTHNRVGFDFEERRLFRDNIGIHTHTQGTPPSIRDIQLAVELEHESVLISGGKVYYYFWDSTDLNTFDNIQSVSNFMSDARERLKAAKNEFLPGIKSGKLDRVETISKVTDEMWNNLADEYESFIYEAVR